jgi:AraC family transcriptional regulator
MASSRASRSLHRAQVAQARRYLRAHLAEPVTLAAVARAAGASPYHLARLYHAFTGETVFRTLTRFRLELAARRLLEAPSAPVSRVALEAGYGTPSSFDKAFGAALGLSPTAYRRAPAAARPTPPRTPRPRAAQGFRLSRAPTVRQARPLRVAYVREQGEYGEVAAPLAWRRLDRCLGDRGWAGRVRAGAAHDDPGRVVTEALRYDAAILLEAHEAPPPGTACATWAGGLHAVFEFRGPYRCISWAFDRLFRVWAARGWPPLRDAPCLELYRDLPGEVAEADLLTELWLPVVPR